MILDKQNELDYQHAYAASAATQNSIDLSQFRQISEGEQLGILIDVLTSADHTTGDETYQFDLQTDSDPAFGTPTSLFSMAISYADLVVGKQIFIPLPNIKLFEEYIRGFFTLGGTTPSVTVSAYVQPKSMVDEYRSYKNGYTIL